MPVALIVLDAFPSAWVNPSTTPTLWSLLVEGGWNPKGGIAELTAATYPNHATFVTGAATVDHGIMTNRVRKGDGWIMASEIGPRTSTLFDACRAEDRRSVAVTGDHHLIGVCGADAADAHWPPSGAMPDGVERNVGGYIADDEVVAAAAELGLSQADFVFAQLDSVDGTRHRYGATSPEAVGQCHRTDAALGRLLDLLRPRWNDLAVLVVSDHDQENIGPQDPVDLRDQLPAEVEVENQGTAALVVGDITIDALTAPAEVEGCVSLDTRHHVVWGSPGQLFSRQPTTLAAEHGSPRTWTQLAVVGGGHPLVPELADRVAASRPQASHWAGWVAELLGLDWRPLQAEPLPRRVP